MLPDLDPDERTLVAALDALGVVAEPRVWDDPSVRWSDFDLVVVRSTWDYAARRDAFLAWCAAVPRVLNSVAVLTWNTDKSYLRSLAAEGIPIVPTTWITTDSHAGASDLPDGSLVVKPSVSSGAQNKSVYAVIFNSFFLPPLVVESRLNGSPLCLLLTAVQRQSQA